MADITVFKRYELKYMLTVEQKEKLLKILESHMKLDDFGRSTIRNIYFDTDDFLLIRRSIDKPIYKEKIRIRSYKKADHKSKVFVELKKKYDSVVYKRRVTMAEEVAMAWMDGSIPCPGSDQITKEIDYCRKHYEGIKPKVMLSYEREAYYMLDGSDFRVTFDDTILAREDNVSLCSETYGTPLLKDGMVLMELKVSSAIPKWMVDFLSSEKIYKCSFSKYGAYYKDYILPELKKQGVFSAEAVKKPATKMYGSKIKSGEKVYA